MESLPYPKDEKGRFLTGNIGGGRPKGSRNKLAESFLADVLEEWETHGKLAVTEMREKNPGDFVKMVASIVPKENILSINSEIEMSDDELRERIRSLAASIAPFLDGTGDAGEGAETKRLGKEPPQLH